MELAADRPGDLGEPALDRHVDVLVAGGERERAVAELALDLVEPAQQLVAILGGDDLARGQHRRVGPRLRDVVGPEPPVEADRVVQARNASCWGSAKRDMERPMSLDAPRRGRQRSAAATRSTWPSVISGKNGSAIERAATSSHTGNSPSRWPKRSR